VAAAEDRWASTGARRNIAAAGSVTQALRERPVLRACQPRFERSDRLEAVEDFVKARKSIDGVPRIWGAMV
jgi:hypothetical protein